MEKLNLYTGGHPFQVDDLKTLQDGVIDALKGVVDGLSGNNQSFILQGVVNGAFPGIYTLGYIYFNGEVYPVDAHPTTLFLSYGHQFYWQVEEVVISPSPVTYYDTTTHNVHVRRRMKLVGAATPPANSVLASAVVRLNQILGVTPKQGIIMYSGSVTNFDTNGKGKSGTQLDGWALCTGNTISIPGGGTLLTPDLRGKFIVGYNPLDPDYNAIGNTGGEKTHTLLENEIPSHTHPDNFSIDSANTYVATAGSGWFATGGGSAFYNATTPHSHSLSGGVEANTGDQAHENRPPYLTLAYIIKLI